MTIRKSVRNLSDDELIALRNAFGKMMGISDNRGYDYMAGIHGIPQFKCKHGEAGSVADPNFRLFLPWHRAYLYWFEKYLQDSSGEAVIDFTEVEAGIFEGLRQGEGVYILQDLAAARSMAKSMDQMIGDWSIVRGNGQPVCGLTLTNTEAGPDNFQVFLKPKCDAAIAQFNPTQWRLDRGQIILLSKAGEAWQFEADDNAQWRRVPDSADGLVMLRGQ